MSNFPENTRTVTKFSLMEFYFNAIWSCESVNSDTISFDYIGIVEYEVKTNNNCISDSTVQEHIDKYSEINTFTSYI